MTLHTDFIGIVLEASASGVSANLRMIGQNELPDGDITINVEYSTLNFKDGLAYTGAAGIVNEYPIVPGVDLAGTVLESNDSRLSVGDRVTVNGCRMGERHWGGHAQRARVPAGWVVKLPENISTRTAMGVGTAGLTSMLCVLALERHEVTPAGGPVVVTGSSGGVGSVAISLLSKRGYEVWAVTGRPEEGAYLERLGAQKILDRSEFSQPVRPLSSARWAAGIDAVGSLTLANVLAATKYGGVVAACGNAQGMDLPASVAPFILRGVTLVGVESVETPLAKRIAAWDALSESLDQELLETMITEVKLAQVPELATQIVKGQVRGRVVINLQES